MKETGSGKKIVVHMVGNAHIDPVWLWSWQEGYQVIKETFRSMLDLMNEFTEFIFTCSSATFYEWIERGDPDMFEEIRKRVKEGRWTVVGGWWIEPDCNIPAGESFIRQGLYGQRYFKERLGVTAEVGYNIDSFGHNCMLPQILSKCGLKNYIYMRPRAEDNDKVPGNVFWWKSIDGSMVLCSRIPFSYVSKDEDIEEHVKRDFETVTTPLRDVMCFYGLGDHGGGPTRKHLKSILKMRERDDAPTIIFSSPNRFFRKIRQQRLSLPVFLEDLQHHASGCYSVHSEVKRNNLRAEKVLCSAEKFMVLANVLFGREYPQKKLTRAWKNVLFAQFHDILAGTSIFEAYQDVRDIQGEALHQGNEELYYAAQTLFSNINTMGEGIPIVVFNPHSWRSRFPIEVEGVDGEGSLLDDEGKVLPIQRTRCSAAIESKWRQRISFVADLPAFGYQVYHNIARKTEYKETQELEASRNSIENEWLRLEIDPSTGYFSRVYDKKNDVDVFRGDACVPLVLEDSSDTWSHGVRRFRDVIGTFSNAETDLIEYGPVRAVIRIENRYKNSLVRTFVNLYRRLPFIECRVSMNWQEKNKMLKIGFPVNIERPVATYSIPYGYIVRPSIGEEEPAQQWVDVSGQATNKKGQGLTYGVSLCNDSKYSYDIKGSEIRLTVLRSPPYAHHIPYKLDPNLTYRYIDQGWQDINFILLPHIESWRESKTVKLTEELNVKPYVIVDYSHEGILQPSRSFIEVDKENIIISVLKKHEDSEDIILRCYETTGKETEAKIKLSFINKELKAVFKPCEIKTFIVPTKRKAKAAEVNMLEYY